MTPPQHNLLAEPGKAEMLPEHAAIKTTPIACHGSLLYHLYKALRVGRSNSCQCPRLLCSLAVSRAAANLLHDCEPERKSNHVSSLCQQVWCQPSRRAHGAMQVELFLRACVNDIAILHVVFRWRLVGLQPDAVEAKLDSSLSQALLCSVRPKNLVKPTAQTHSQPESMDRTRMKSSGKSAESR